MQKRIKFMAGTLALGIFLTSCKKELDIIVVRDNTEHTNQDFSTVQLTEQPTEMTINTDEETLVAEIIEPETFETTVEQENLPDYSFPEETESVKDETLPPETFLEEIEPTIEQIEEQKELPQNIVCYTTTNVNLRSINNTKSLIIETLEPNTPIFKIASCKDNWDLVQVGDKIGFICRDYLIYTNETYEKPYEVTLKNDIAVTTTALNFRSGPSTSYPIKKTLVTRREGELTEIEMCFKENEELRVIAEVDEEWLMVEYNGEVGFVHKNYTISLTKELNNTYPEFNFNEFDPKKVVYAHTSLNIRKYNSTETEVIRTLDTYESLRVLGEYDDWYLIMTNEHEFGFVHSEHVTELTGKTTITDLSEQRSFIYNDDERLTYTPVTTGKDSTPTDIGLFKIYYMKKEINLNEGKDWVFHWMNYNNGEGIHDAWWRQVYGEQNHHTSGSNGCTNTPYAAVKVMYENSSKGQKVLVHK